MTDDEAQLVWEKQQLADAQAKRDTATDAGTRYFYECGVLMWGRSIAVLERRIKEQS